MGAHPLQAAAGPPGAYRQRAQPPTVRRSASRLPLGANPESGPCHRSLHPGERTARRAPPGRSGRPPASNSGGCPEGPWSEMVTMVPSLAMKAMSKGMRVFLHPEAVAFTLLGGEDEDHPAFSAVG